MMKKYLFENIKSFLFFTMAVLGLSFCCEGIVFAKDDLTLNTCKYSEKYLEWLKLSDEEKSKTQMPVICDLSATESNRLQANVKKSFDKFAKVYLPASYDIRTTSSAAQIRNQMQTGTCWAFSTSSSLEIFAKSKLNVEQVYSARYMEYKATRELLDGKINEWGFHRNVGDGGNNIMSAAMLANNIAPVLETDMPFQNNKDLVDISEVEGLDVQLDVNGIALGGVFEEGTCSTMMNEMKQHILESGAIVSSLYFTQSPSYYNESTSALFYNGTSFSNHAITIVGWDDNYSKTNFSSANRPSGDGAWIIQNSWGEDFGDGGYNYVSYYDNRICGGYMAIKDVDTKVEDNAYVYDKLGHNILVGYSSGSYSLNSAYGMVVFDKKNDVEILREINFGTPGAGNYKIYYKEGDASNDIVANMTLIGSGKMDYYGYLTHKLEEPIYMDSDVLKYSIVVYWEMDNNYSPLPLGSNAYEQYIHLEVDRGMSYTSPFGETWSDAYDMGAVVSIKAFTDDVNYELSSEVKTVSKDSNNKITVKLNMKTSNIEQSKLNLIVIDNEDNFIDDVNINFTSSNGSIDGADLIFDQFLNNGKYFINVYYDNVFIETLEFTVLFGMSSDEYKINNVDNTVYVYDSVEVSSFLSKINGSSGKVTSNGVSVTSGYVGTGMMIDGYVIILRGDVTGDGLIKVSDVMKISKYTVEGTGLENEYFKAAADVTNDSLIKANDVMKISKYTVEGGSL